MKKDFLIPALNGKLNVIVGMSHRTDLNGLGQVNVMTDVEEKMNCTLRRDTYEPVRHELVHLY